MTEETVARILSNLDRTGICGKCGDRVNETFSEIYKREHGRLPTICLQCFALGFPVSDRLRRWGFELHQTGGQIDLYRRGIDADVYEYLSNLEGERPTDWNEPVMVGRYEDVLSPDFQLSVEITEEPVKYPSMYEYIIHLGATETRAWCRECGYSFGVNNQIWAEALEDPDGEYIECPGCGSYEVEEAR